MILYYTTRKFRAMATKQKKFWQVNESPTIGKEIFNCKHTKKNEVRPRYLNFGLKNAYRPSVNIVKIYFEVIPKIARRLV